MVMVEPPAVESIMAIAAHPDDLESWCAGRLRLPLIKVQLDGSAELIAIG